jgi:CHAT domain-containing protein/Tfp pilus assembly protein PilF
MLSISLAPKIRVFIVLSLLEFTIVPIQLMARQTPFPDKEKAWIYPGKALIEKGDYDQAITYFKNRLSLADLGDADKMRIYHILGFLLLFADRIEEAKLNSQAAYDWTLKLRFPEEASSFETELVIQEAFIQALKLRMSGDIPGSNLKFEEAHRIARSIEGQSYQLRIVSAWSMNYLSSAAAHPRYLDLNVQALNLALALNYRVEACRAAKKIGTYYAVKSDFSNALSYYLKALYYVRNQGNSNDLIVCLNNIAGVYISLGDYVKAQDYLSEVAAHIVKQDAAPFQPSTFINLGQLFRSFGQSFQSEEYHQRALKCFTTYLGLSKEKGGGALRLQALAGIASIYVEQGRLDEARAILIPALEKARKAENGALLAGTILSCLAEAALKTGELSDAEKYFQETLSISKQNNSPLLMMKAAYGLGRIAEARADYGKAVDFYNLGLEIISDGYSRIVNDTNRAEFIGRSREPYQALIELYAKLSKKINPGVYEHEIFRLSEYFRARSYMEFQERQSLRRDHRSPEPAGFQEEKLNNERLSLLKTLSKGAPSMAEQEDPKSRIMHIDDMLDAALFDQYLQSDKAEALAPPISLNLLQSQVLTERTALIEYFLGDERSILICVTKDSLRLAELPSAQSINDSLTAFLSFLEDPSIPAAKGLPAAQRLYKSLLSPIDDFIPAAVDHLIIVPDGILFRLPFEALAFQTPGSSTVKYVNDRFAVSYSPSASALFYLGEKKKALFAKDVLALGVSKYPGPTRRSGASDPYSASSILDDLYRRSGFVMESIPNVQREIADLAMRVKPEKIDAYYGQKATERAFKSLDLESYRLIHLACHAFSDESYPLRSALVLSAETDDEEDGYLQVSEMYNMRTNADLVVLSACQTGRGRIIRNEGILGLPRVFFYMGARSVISTLWPINDSAGVTFMKLFYDSYFRGASKAEALRAAKQKMAKTRFGHPFYWASYVLTGEF